MCVAGSRRFAVKQIKEKTTAVSANQKSGLFCSSRQNLSTLSSSSLTSNLTHPYSYSVTWPARNTSIARSQNASLDSKISEMCVSLPASSTVFSMITTSIKAWIVSNERLETYLFNHINGMYKQNEAVSLQEWEACHESSIYVFVSLNRS